MRKAEIPATLQNRRESERKRKIRVRTEQPLVQETAEGQFLLLPASSQQVILRGKEGKWGRECCQRISRQEKSGKKVRY